MGKTYRRAAAAVAAAVAITAALLVVTAQPAAADPVVTVEPSTVTDGQTVTISTSGFPSGTYAVVQCPSEPPIIEATSALSLCRWIVPLTNGTPPATIEGTVHSSFLTIDGSRTVNCLLETDGCVVGVGVLADTGLVQARAPIQFTSSLVASPSRGLVDGATVELSSGAADGDWTVAQCHRAFIEPGGAVDADAWCGARVPVVVQAGVVSPAVTVDDPLTTRAATAVTCGYDQCVLVLESPSGTLGGVAPISFGEPFVGTNPPLPVPPDSIVIVEVGGMPTDTVTVGLCIEPVSEATCLAVATVTLDVWGSGTLPGITIPTSFDVGGTLHDCTTEPCALAVWNGTVVYATLPITLLPPPILTLSPDTGLLEGDTMHVSGSGFAAGSPYLIYLCAPRFVCADHGTVITATDGALSADIVVSQRVHDSGYCRADCQIFAIPLSGGPGASAGFAMAVGTLTVTPTTGLVDGQEVQVSATDLLPTYAGRFLGPFPTGGWALAQCDAAVAANVTLYGVFLHCSLGPSLQPVTIAGSTLDATAAVEGTITRILGGTTDCTAAPGACVLGLFRLEQDGSGTAYLQPLTFAT